MLFDSPRLYPYAEQFVQLCIVEKQAIGTSEDRCRSDLFYGSAGNISVMLRSDKSAVSRDGVHLLQPVSGLSGLFQPYRDATIQVAGTGGRMRLCFLSVIGIKCLSRCPGPTCSEGPGVDGRVGAGTSGALIAKDTPTPRFNAFFLRCLRTQDIQVCDSRRSRMAVIRGAG